MPNIKLNFINQTKDANNSSVILFQKNEATSYDDVAIAWRVIQNCGRGDNHPFNYPIESQVSASDSYGNFTPLQSAQEGQVFSMVRSDSGDVLQYTATAAGTKEVAVLNQLPMGAINANIFKDGKLLGTKTNIVPSQKAVFQFTPSLWIGVASQVVEGSVMDSAIISQINTQINLQGISSADIVMTGGGAGPTAMPFQFTLENVQHS